ncbi:type II secretion system protein [Candidatus Parcubacteria bacterium]|nr:type II secretion system protein [Candidatus Parcubacteria bacterium]
MKKFNNKGFTLIELLVVIAIIGVLSTMAIINVRSAQEKARDTKRITAVNSIRTAVEMYIADTGNPPAITITLGDDWGDGTVGTSLQALIGSYIQGGMPDDPSGDANRRFCYCRDGTTADYLIAAVAEATAKTFEGDMDGVTTSYVVAECVCSDGAIPSAVVNCTDAIAGDVDGVNGPTFCLGTSL